MRFIHYVSKGNTTVPAFLNRYKKILTPEEITTTLKEMEERGLINRQGDQLTLTALSTLIM